MGRLQGRDCLGTEGKIRTSQDYDDDVPVSVGGTVQEDIMTMTFVLRDILTELKIMNMHMGILTNETIREEDLT